MKKNKCTLKMLQMMAVQRDVSRQDLLKAIRPAKTRYGGRTCESWGSDYLSTTVKSSLLSKGLCVFSRKVGNKIFYKITAAGIDYMAAPEDAQSISPRARLNANLAEAIDRVERALENLRAVASYK